MSTAAVLFSFVTMLAIVSVVQVLNNVHNRAVFDDLIKVYDRNHQRDVRLCTVPEKATCGSPGECQRVECFKFRGITAPRCQFLPDVALNGESCDDNDPDTVSSVCESGICEGTTTGAPTMQPTASPLPPTPAPISGMGLIRTCYSNETGLCADQSCQSLRCYIVNEETADPACVYAANSSLNGEICDDGNFFSNFSACYEGVCRNEVTHQCDIGAEADCNAQNAPPCRRSQCVFIPNFGSHCSDIGDVAANGDSCDDYDPDTTASECYYGICIGTSTAAPTFVPTSQPSATPTSLPTTAPTAQPTPQPTVLPTANPTRSPTFAPTPQPTVDALRMCNASELATCGAPLQCMQFDCRIVSEQVSEPLCTPMTNASANGVSCDDGDVNTDLSVCFNGACRADVARACTSLEVQTYCGSLTPTSVCTQVGCVILPSGSAFCADHANYSANGIACDYDGGYLSYDPRSKCYNGHCVPIQATSCDPSARDSPIIIATAGSASAALITDTGKVSAWGFSSSVGIGVPLSLGTFLYAMPGMFGYVEARNGSSDADYYFLTDIVGWLSGFCVTLNTSRVLCWGACGPCGLPVSSSYGAGGSFYPRVFTIPLVKIHQENGTQLLVKKIYSSATSDHVCAILQNDKPKCWGLGSNGQLGYGSSGSLGYGPTGGSSTPDSQAAYTIIPTANGTASQIATGLSHTCALTPPPSIQLYCWGSNSFGQLGYGDSTSRTSSTTSVNVTTDGATLRQVVCASFSTCILTENLRDVKCWGSGTSGQLGQNVSANLGNTPTTIPALIPYIQGIVSASDYANGVRVESMCGGTDFYCAYTNVGKVKCWGDNINGQLGIGSTNAVGDSAGTAVAVSIYARILSAVELLRGIFVTQISCGKTHVCAVLSNNQVKCWGVGSSGQLGLGSSISTSTSSNTTADQEWYPYTKFRPVETPADSACSCVCVQQNTSDVSLLDNFLIDTTGVECPVVPTPVGTQYCPSTTFSDVRCVCDDLIHSAAPTRSPTRGPTLSPTQTPTATPTLSPTQSPTATPTLSPTQSPSISPTASPTASPVPAPP